MTGCTTLAKKSWCRDQLTLRVRRSLFTSQRNSLLKSKQPSQFSQFSHSVMSDSWRPHRLWPTRLLCSWDSPSKNTGMGCHFLPQGIFLTQGSNLGLLHCRQILYHLSHHRTWYIVNTNTFTF